MWFPCHLVNPDGSIDEKDAGNWSAAEKVPAPGSRKIWSVIPGTDYKADYNNFRDTYATEIGNVMALYENDIIDYHRKTDTASGSSLLRRCANSAGVLDGTDDDLKGLINFVRGTDYFDYDGDCDVTEVRTKSGKNIYLGDIYHSQLLVLVRLQLIQNLQIQIRKHILEKLMDMTMEKFFKCEGSYNLRWF